MRTFEILLILLLVADSATRFFFAERRPVWISTIPVLGFLLGIIHLAGEGARWQMIPLYGILIVAFTAAMVRLFRTGDILIDGGRLSRAAGIVLIGSAALTLAVGSALPVFEFPPPGGDYNVGVRDIALNDRDKIRIYYPAEAPKGARVPYAIDVLDAYREYVSERYGISIHALSHLNQVRSYSFRDAELSHELPRYRVLISEPEPDKPGSRATHLLESLASQGFVVVTSLTHVSGSTEDENNFDVSRPVSEQIAAALEALDPSGSAGWLADRMDLARIGVFGLGSAGRTAIDLCAGGTFRAGAAIGSSTALTKTDVPFLFFHPENREHTSFAEAQATTYTLAARGMMEDNFGDDAFVSPLMPLWGAFGSIDPERASHITSSYVGAFFNKHLTRGTVEAILDGPSPEYPEVTIHIQDAEE